MAKRDTGK